MPLLDRTELGWNERFRRSLYLYLRDELERVLINEGLVSSYHRFREAGKPYPFVEMRELKPRAKIIHPEYPEHNHFLVIFYEGTLPPECKTHIRFFDSNKVTKENIGNIADLDIRHVFHQKMRFFEDRHFRQLLTELLKPDFAILIQRDLGTKGRFRYGLTHFHVRIDWPLAYAAENLGRDLRYIAKHLYEKSDRFAEVLQQKLFEYYGFHHTVGGRRTAALVAARYLSRFDFYSAVFIASAESRTLYRLSDQNILKYVLIKLTEADRKELADSIEMGRESFDSLYLIDRNEEYGVGILLVTYHHNEHSSPPPDGKLRELNPDYHWLNVDKQLLVPPPWSLEARPLPVSRVYM